MNNIGVMLALCNQITHFSLTDVNYKSLYFQHFTEGIKVNAAQRKTHLKISIKSDIT